LANTLVPYNPCPLVCSFFLCVCRLSPDTGGFTPSHPRSTAKSPLDFSRRALRAPLVLLFPGPLLVTKKKRQNVFVFFANDPLLRERLALPLRFACSIELGWCAPKKLRAPRFSCPRTNQSLTPFCVSRPHPIPSSGIYLELLYFFIIFFPFPVYGFFLLWMRSQDSCVISQHDAVFVLFAHASSDSFPARNRVATSDNILPFLLRWCRNRLRIRPTL